MKKFFFFLAVMSITGWQRPGPGWTAEELARADTAKEAGYMSDTEREVIKLVNLARINGTKYLQTYFQQYRQVPYEEMAGSDNTYIRSLKKDLDKVRNLPVFLPGRDLYKAAISHARDTGRHGLVGHRSSDGTGMGDRLVKYVKNWRKLAENCSYGYNDAASIVGQLLLDEDVPSLGHRKNILSPDLTHIGVGIAPHSQYRYNCVMDFCARSEY